MVKVAILAKETFRTPEGITSIAESLAAQGFRVVASGITSLTLNLEPEEIAEKLDVNVREVPLRLPGENDFGSPGGYESDDIPIPSWLKDRVESIAVIPPAIRLSR